MCTDMGKMSSNLLIVITVLICVVVCRGGSVHKRYARNVGESSLGNDPDNLVGNFPIIHQPDQSNIVSILHNIQADQSYGLAGNDNEVNDNQPSVLSLGDNNLAEQSPELQRHQLEGNNDLANNIPQHETPEHADTAHGSLTRNNEQPVEEHSENQGQMINPEFDGNQQHGEDMQHDGNNVGSLRDGVVDVGVDENGGVHRDDENSESIDPGEHSLQHSSIEGNDVEHSSNETIDPEWESKTKKIQLNNTTEASLNNYILTQAIMNRIQTTSASSRSHGRRDLPENERIDHSNLLLDASLKDKPTTAETVISYLNSSSGHNSVDQHRPFFMEPVEIVNNQSQEVSLDHGQSAGSNHEVTQNQGEEHDRKDDNNHNVGPDADHNEPNEQQRNPQQGQGEQTVPVIQAVTLSHEGILPEEKHPHESGEPEIVLRNQNNTTVEPIHTEGTTTTAEEIEHGGEQVNQEPAIGHGGVNISVDKGSFNHSHDNEGIEGDHQMHSFNPLILPRTTMFPAIEPLTIAGQTTFLPTHAQSIGSNEEHVTGNAISLILTTEEIEHESGGSGHNTHVEGSGAENQNSETYCNEMNGNPGESHAPETGGTDIESIGAENGMTDDNKHNKIPDKSINCRLVSSIVSTTIQSPSVIEEQVSSMTLPNIIEPTITMSQSIHGIQVDRLSVFPSIASDVYSSLLKTSELSEFIASSGQTTVTETEPIGEATMTLLSIASSYLTQYSSSISSWSATDSYLLRSSEYITDSEPHSTTTGSYDIDSFTLTTTPLPQFFYSSSAIEPVKPSAAVSPSEIIQTAYSSSVKQRLSSPTEISVSTETAYISTAITPLKSSLVSSDVTTFTPSTVTTYSIVTPKTIFVSHTPPVATDVSTTANPKDTTSMTQPVTEVSYNGTTTLRTLLLPCSTKLKIPDILTNTAAAQTTKKRVTVKDTEKTETGTTTPAAGSVRTRAGSLEAATTGRAPITPPSIDGPVITIMPRHDKTTKGSDITTPPQVFLQIWIQMSSCQFYDQKQRFINELKQMIVSQKQVTVEREQFVVTIKDVPEELCEDVPNTIINGMETTLDQITVEMYMVDKKGNIDIRLTYDVSSVIKKTFRQTSSAFKDKILHVDVQNSLFNTKANQKESIDNSKDDTSVTMVIVLGSVGGSCCVMLVILQVILIHRRVSAKRKASFISRHASLRSMDHVALGVIPKSRPNSGYWNPALSDIDDMCDSKHSHLLNFSELANFCMDVTALHEEFQTIPFEAPNSSVVPIGEDHKNRFANVLPHKQTRVKLQTRSGNYSDYINANYITGYKGNQKTYIATQSPLVNTVEDFWRMVWEQQSRVILMLNPVLINRKPKQSTCYWPDDMKTDIRRLYGDFSVTLKKREVQQDYIECTLELMDIEGNLKREVRHFWLTCWPESMSLEPLKFVKFILDSRPHYENSRAPAIIHCGPGQGRTGALIAADYCMRRFEDKRRVDILNCVYKMRNERSGSVQNKEQYTLVYQALNEYAVLLSSPSLSTRSSIITLHAML